MVRKFILAMLRENEPHIKNIIFEAVIKNWLTGGGGCTRSCVRSIYSLRGDKIWDYLKYVACGEYKDSEHAVRIYPRTVRKSLTFMYQSINSK